MVLWAAKALVLNYGNSPTDAGLELAQPAALLDITKTGAAKLVLAWPS